MTAEEVIDLLKLKPLPMEGGFYHETYRSTERVGEKSMGTAIYYLLTPETCSALHRLPTDEVYHFYLGDTVQLLLLAQESKVVTLGPNLSQGELPQFVVPANTWQGSCLIPGGSFALMGTTMAPGFEFSDYEGANREDLLSRYSAVASLIERLT